MRWSPRSDRVGHIDFGAIRMSLALCMNRRCFFDSAGAWLGCVALASLLDHDLLAGSSKTSSQGGLPHFRPKAKRVIYLFQSGAPSQLDLFDYKPNLKGLRGT